MFNSNSPIKSNKQGNLTRQTDEATDIDVSGIIGNESGLMSLVQEVDRDSPSHQDLNDNDL